MTLFWLTIKCVGLVEKFQKVSAHHWFRFLTIKSNDLIITTVLPVWSVAPFERRFHENTKCSWRARLTDQPRRSPQPPPCWPAPGPGSCSWRTTAPASSASPWWRCPPPLPEVSRGTWTWVHSRARLLLPSSLPLLLLSPCWWLSDWPGWYLTVVTVAHMLCYGDWYLMCLLLPGCLSQATRNTVR